MTSTSGHENPLLEASSRMRQEALQFRAKFDVFIDQLNRVIDDQPSECGTESTESEER